MLSPAPRNSGVLEFKLSRGYDLVPKDSNGLSDPYVLVKYGSRTMFRSKVVKKSLNPEWNQVATLAAPSPEEVILVVSVCVGGGGGEGGAMCQWCHEVLAVSVVLDVSVVSCGVGCVMWCWLC